MSRASASPRIPGGDLVPFRRRAALGIGGGTLSFQRKYVLEDPAVIKRLTRHGNSLALVLDKPILELLNIDAETPLELKTDGDGLRIVPVRDPARRRKVDEAVREANRRYGKALKRLSE